MEVQQEAWDIVRDSLHVLEWIVSGNYTYQKAATKPIRVYPRDINEALRILQSVGRAGVMPEGNSPQRVSVTEKPAVIEKSMLPLLPVNANFSSVTVTTPDGARFAARVERDGEVVEGAAEE